MGSCLPFRIMAEIYLQLLSVAGKSFGTAVKHVVVVVVKVLSAVSLRFFSYFF